MKNPFTSAIILGIGLAVCSCSGGREPEQDHSPISILVTHGYGEEYFETLARDVKDEYGIEVQFVDAFALNSSGQTVLDLVHDNMHTDIVLTTGSVNDSILKECCLDLMAYTNISDHFNYDVISRYTTEDGTLYQIPLSSSVTGITYNATLMEERGWKPPRNFTEMLELKRKCDRAGIEFAYTNLSVTGCGFIYLFFLNGSDWLSTLPGEEWLKGFLNGEQGIEDLKNHSEYFRKWVENGLFGNILTSTTGELRHKFSERRALFCINTVCSYTGYDGPLFNADGQPTGIILHDTYKTMPWISEDGSNNCFALFDKSFVMVNRKLLDPDQKDRRKNVARILDYMAGEKMMAAVAETTKDTYISSNSFTITPDRTYADYADIIRNGYLQPWYYFKFGTSAIVDTGGEINSYILNTVMSPQERTDAVSHSSFNYKPGASFDSIFDILRSRVQDSEPNYVCTVKEHLDREQTAEIAAISGAIDLQSELDKAGENAVVQIALVPYVNDIHELKPWLRLPVENSELYPGPLESGDESVIIPWVGNDMAGIWMKGALVSQIMEKGFVPEALADDKEYGPYRYACVIKDGITLESDTEYLVCVHRSALEPNLISTLDNAGKVIPLSGNVTTGLDSFLKSHPELDANSIKW